MQTLVAILPFMLLLLIYLVVGVVHAACIKLSGRILHGLVVRWKDAYIFAAIITVVTVITRAVVAAEGFVVPLVWLLLASFVFNLLLGGWFFGPRVVNRQGQPCGWNGGAGISAIAFLLLILVSFLSNTVIHLITIALHF